MDIQEMLEACDTNNNDATKETREKKCNTQNKTQSHYSLV
jgi:hypothetical protein